MTDKTDLYQYHEKKICEVCGDQALSYNFNALTCESCKAFFRRNAFKDKLKCAFKNDCPINRVTRKFCQCCRLKKCFKVGMKRELIMSENQKELKRRKIEANRAKAAKASDRKTNGFSINKNCYGLSNGIIHQKASADQSCWTDNTARKEPDPFHFVSFPQTRSLVDSSTQTSSELVDTSVQTDEFSCKCFLTDFAESSSSFISIDVPTQISKLDSNHRKLLDDLSVANSALEAPLESEVGNLATDAFQVCNGENGRSLLDVINLTAIAIRRLIKMCKRISAFKALCTQDQVSLLKHGCTQMMLLRSVLNFDPDRNSWKIPHTVNHLSRIKVEVLKEAQGNLYEAHEAFLTTFDPRASHDKYLIYILTVIELFDPTRPNLVHSDVIQQQQNCYYDLLKCYLENRFGPDEAVTIFNHLLSKMEELHRLCEDHIRVYLNVNPSQVEPLLIEIFDLKPH